MEAQKAASKNNEAEASLSEVKEETARVGVKKKKGKGKKKKSRDTEAESEGEISLKRISKKTKADLPGESSQSAELVAVREQEKTQDVLEDKKSEENIDNKLIQDALDIKDASGKELIELQPMNTAQDAEEKKDIEKETNEEDSKDGLRRRATLSELKAASIDGESSQNTKVSG